MPVYRDPDDTRDAGDALSPTHPPDTERRRLDPVEWLAGALFVLIGAVFALCLVAMTWGIGQEPDMNAIHKAPADVLAANAPRP